MILLAAGFAITVAAGAKLIELAEPGPVPTRRAVVAAVLVLALILGSHMLSAGLKENPVSAPPARPASCA